MSVRFIQFQSMAIFAHKYFTGSVATYLRSDGMFHYQYTTNSPLIVTEFCKSIINRQSYGKKHSGTFFFRTHCIKRHCLHLETVYFVLQWIDG